jgi:hypothetical protein
MGYEFKDLKKPRANAGAGQPVNPNVILIDTEDILYIPNRDSIDKIKIEGNIILKPGAKATRLYMTPSTHKKTLTIEGDDDAKGFAQTYEGWHPGDELEVNAFIQNALNANFIMITINCYGDYRRLYGASCNPLKFTGSMEGTNEKTGWTMTFEQTIRSGDVAAFYYGELPKTGPFDVTGASVTFEKANGAVYQLASSSATSLLTLTNGDYEHGNIVSLIGGGGTAPYELEAGTIVFLENGTTWVGLNKSVINLRVFDTGSGIVFFETGRN